jgi:DUF1680 family protein
MKKLMFLLLLGSGVRAQSPHATLEGMGLGEVHWTQGFWAERFAVCRDSMLPHLWRIYTDKKVSHAFENFRIAAGLDTGSHVGPPFHDGDFYKLLEGMSAMYAVTHDRKLDSLMDMAIAVIAKGQRPDGYIHTPVVIGERNGQVAADEEKINFEKYNIGHLMTAACVHYRATGKETLLDVAIRAANYLMGVYQRSSPQSARDAICPSHYMGLVELYRVTKNAAYLQLAKNLIDIRGSVNIGTDDNQDRVPFRSQAVARGHAVRANYLYAGVADVVAETGNDSLWHCLDAIWNNVTERKLYITGGCGALYDGVSPDGVSYNPAAIQEVHQAYGRDYQLPNSTAHNETCANIGNMLWNWRMLEVSGDSRYADVLEQSLYNSVLSGVSLDGNRYFYTNPLRASKDFPYALRWSGGREEYISLSNCCPPNLARTLAEVGDYAYSVNSKGLYVNLYGGNILSTKDWEMEEKTDYPWDGKVLLIVKKAPLTANGVFLRIPGWCSGVRILVNGKPSGIPAAAGKYAGLSHVWKAGDVIELDMAMPAVMIAANPLVEETKGQVAVRRGPIVYCLESPDLAPGQSIFTVAMPSKEQLKPVPMRIGNSRFMALEGVAKLLSAGNGKLYQELSVAPAKDIPVKMIPYYAWANRGATDMTVWMDLWRE